jgi:hypothetical protein
LYRNHRLSIHCARCQEEFRTQAELEEHSRVDPPCKIIPKLDIEGINDAQMQQLRSRKGGIKSEENKWKQVYMICFPDTDETTIPSPFKRECKMISKEETYFENH